MAELSNHLLVATILAYVVAMVTHAAEYAFGPRSHAGRTPARPARVPATVGGPVTVTAAGPRPEPPVGPGAPPVGLGRARWFGVAAAALTLLGVLAHLGALVVRGLAANRMPWGNMYEFILSATFVGAVAWVVLLVRRPALRYLGLFVCLALVVLLAVGGMLVYTPVGPLVPALNSAWFVVHVSTVVLSSGIFLLGVVPATMYLVRAGHDKGRRSFPYTLGRRLPAANLLERLTFQLHAFAFPIFTFGALIAGPIWAEASWGRYWGWDPKEVWAFISWIVYAAYLHARATPSVRRSTATWLAILGFATMLMNLFGVNFFFEGFHSYAGVD